MSHVLAQREIMCKVMVLWNGLVKNSPEQEANWVQLEHELRAKLTLVELQRRCFFNKQVDNFFLISPWKQVVFTIFKRNRYYRDSLAGQLQLALAKADSEQLARTIAEEQLSDVEKEKTMLELEIKEILSRHKSDLGKKDGVITLVSLHPFM